MAKRKRDRAISGAGVFPPLPVIGVAILMAFMYYSTVFVLIDHCLGLASFTGVLQAAVFTWIALFTFVSFFLAVVSDPGPVPPSFAPETENPQPEGTKTRYCDKCSMYKPPRAHHCKVCRRCVLKMDHHCTWINNCVGYSNYKPFIIFIMHAAAASTYAMAILVYDLMQTDHAFHLLSVKLFYVISSLVVGFLCLITGSLLCWHIYLLTHNMTTIEYREAVRAKWLARKSGHKYHHHFDLGICRNLDQVLGPNVLTWLCPTAVRHLRDGTQFPSSDGY